MSNLIEVAVTSDANGALWSCCVWDPQAGTQLCTYKGDGSTTSHGFAFINNEFVITANNSKPLLHIWPVNSQEQISGLRFVVPGKVTALAVSPDGVYCVAAVSEIIYIWL